MLLNDVNFDDNGSNNTVDNSNLLRKVSTIENSLNEIAQLTKNLSKAQEEQQKNQKVQEKMQEEMQEYMRLCADEDKKAFTEFPELSTDADFKDSVFDEVAKNGQVWRVQNGKTYYMPKEVYNAAARVALKKIRKNNDRPILNTSNFDNNNINNDSQSTEVDKVGYSFAVRMGIPPERAAEIYRGYKPKKVQKTLIDIQRGFQDWKVQKNNKK